jgi:hypothetical protein
MSNINPQSIDGAYPIAGQDNNSQGFRDNFTNTVNNFTFAAAELTDLQQNAVLKAALGSVGQTGTPTNDLNYAYLTHAQLKGTVETNNRLSNVTSGSFTIDWATGHYQSVPLVGTSATLTFAANWPASNLYTKLRLQVDTYANVCALTLPAEVSTNISSIQGASGQVITLPAGSTYQFEFSTWNNGTTIAIQDVLRNYDAPIDFNILNATTVNATGNVLATGLSVFGNTRIGSLAIPGAEHTIIGNVSVSGAGTEYFNIAGNILAVGAVLGTTTINGNLVTGATHVEPGYQQVKPTANVAVTVSHLVNRVLIHPTNIIALFGANVTLPNVQVDGTIINISSNVTIAGLDVRPSWNGVVAVSPSGNATVTAGSNTRYMYIAADFTWYKIA